MADSGAPPPTADQDASSSCSDTKTAGATKQDCPLKAKRVVTITWDKSETWCSEGGPISGTTVNYADGEALSIAVTGTTDAGAVTTLPANVSGNAFHSPWDVVDVLPIGGPSWQPRRQLDGATSGVKTPDPMTVRFIPNVKRDRKDHDVAYSRTEPGAAAASTVTVAFRAELESINYLLTIHGHLKYVRGWGKERLQLGDATLTGGFPLYGATQHWGYRDAATGKFKYWDGSAWQDTPAAWIPKNKNHFGIAFYKSGSQWVCRDAPAQNWPQALTDWPANVYQGDGNLTDKTLATWKTNIDSVWTDKFDIKRKECKSTKPECCRYKTRCVAQFEEVSSYASSETIILAYEDARSDSGMWSMGDSRAGLAPHEFGHHLGAPDEYDGVGTTQLGVSDGDGLANGIDDNSIMGVGLSTVKKRHYKGICEEFALLVTDQHGKTYTYQAVDRAANLASPPGTAPAPDGGGSGALVGAIIGGIVGAVAGAIIGFVASGGNPADAVAGALAGGAAGALAGAAIGGSF